MQKPVPVKAEGPDLDSAKARKVVRYIKFDDELGKTADFFDIPAFLERQSLTEKTAAIERTFEKITKQLEATGYPKYLFLEIHLSYTKRSEFIPPINLSNFADLVPVSANLRIITLIDDVFNIWNNIRMREEHSFPGTALRLREILGWRSVETLMAETLAINLTDEKRDRIVKNYLVSVRHPLSTFLNLIVTENPVCAYLSFPISKTRDVPARVADINAFRARMHGFAAEKGTVIFDPVGIDELVLQFALKKTKEGEDVVLDSGARWPLGYKVLADEVRYPIRIPYEQVEEVGLEKPVAETVTSDIENNVRVRDYKLIDISILTVAYRPHFGGPSSGVAKEVAYSVNQGRKAIMYDPDEDSAGPRSPFDDSVPVYRDLKEFYKVVDAFLMRKDLAARNHR